MDLAVRLGVDPKKADQAVRGTVALPYGIGKEVRVLVMARPPRDEEARAAGADHAGLAEYVTKIQGGWADIDVIIATPDVMGEVGKGYKIAIKTLNEGRIGISAQMVGVAQGSLEHGLKYSQERTQLGKPIADFQAVQFLLAELATEIEAARLLTYNAARRKDAHQEFIKEAAMAEVFT